MNEWTVVTSLSVIVGLAAALAGPVVKLNGTISRLSAILEHVLAQLSKLEREDEKLRAKGEELQRMMNTRMDGQDQRLHRCENRLALLEQRKGAHYDSDQLEGTL